MTDTTHELESNLNPTLEDMMPTIVNWKVQRKAI